MRYGSIDSQIPAEPDSSSLLQGGQAGQWSPAQASSPSQNTDQQPSPGLERENALRAPFANISVPRRCTAKDPFWVAAGGSSSQSRTDAANAAATAMAGRGLAGVPLRCLGDVVDAADHEFELEVPEAELSTVHIETWEQRLDWRSFLSEAVASSRARQLFKAFDVEAEPPKYARPPPSSPVSVMENALPSGRARGAPRTSGRDQCVAPSGAGWSPSGSATASPSGAGSSSLQPPSPGAPLGGGSLSPNGAAANAPLGAGGPGEAGLAKGAQLPNAHGNGHGGASSSYEAFDPARPPSLSGDYDAGL